MKLYIDDSAFPTRPQLIINNANVLVCITVTKDSKLTIQTVIDEIKAIYGLTGLPIKYTLDNRLEKEYKSRGRLNEYQVFKKYRRSIIQQIIKRTSGTLFHVSFAWNIIDPKLLSSKNFYQTKYDNTANSIVALLDKSSQSLKYVKGEEWDIILDRFKAPEEKCINSGFSRFKENNRIQNLTTPYNSLYYSLTVEETLLQFADILVGIIRDLLQDCVKDRQCPLQTAQNCAHLIPKILGYPNAMNKFGITGPPEYQEKLLERMMFLVEKYPNLGPLLE